MVFFYGATSEVAWLFLLAYWIGGLLVAAYLYARWNWAGLRGGVTLFEVKASLDSPAHELSESVLRGAPLPAPIFEGDHVEVALWLKSTASTRGPAVLRGRIGSSDLSHASGRVPSAGVGVRRTVGPVRRGPTTAASWTLSGGDITGFYRRQQGVADREIALVLPRFASLTAAPLMREIEAGVAAPRAGTGTELFGVREYQSGDPLRRIHWRSSARHGHLVVREYEPPGMQSLGIFCDPEPPNVEAADQVARLAASEAWDCLRAGGRVVLWAPGTAASRPDESRSFWQLLEWLARYPNPSAADEDAPAVGDAVGIIASAGHEVVEALAHVRRRGGGVRGWAVGVEVDAPDFRSVAVEWPP